MRLILSIILLLLFSCSHNPPVDPLKPEPPKVVDNSPYLTPDKVVEIFLSYDQKIMGAQKEKLSIKAKDRLALIIPNSVFFPYEKIKKIKINKNIKANFTEVKVIGKADLRARDTPIISQWGGTCTAHGLAAGIENSLNSNANSPTNFINLSERHVWSRYHQYSCESAIKAWDRGQACITKTEKWPNKNARPYVGYLNKENCFSYLLKTNYIGDDLEKMMTAFDEGKPIYVGMSVTKSMLNCDTALNPNSTVTTGGHALSIVGYNKTDKVKGGGYFIVKNSWGTGCGDHGYQYIPFSYCQRNDAYCLMWVIDSVK